MPYPEQSSAETLSEDTTPQETSTDKMLKGFARLVSKGYAKKADPDGSGYPVEVVCGDVAPIRGNVHIGLGRAITRAQINKEFAR